MALRDTLERLANAPRLIREHNDRLTLTGPASPWATWPNHLEHIDAPEWAQGYYSLTRHHALEVPAVARARGLICGTIARLPMQVCTAPGVPVNPQPTWIDRSDGTLPAWKRTALAVEDMLFDGWALLSVERGANEWPTRLGYIPFTRWEFDPEGRIRIDRNVERGPDAQPDWQYATDGSVALIPGPHEGVLHFGGDAIKAAADLARTAARASETPIPNIELHDTGDRPLTDDQIDKLVSRWVAARQGKNSGVAYTNKSIELRAHGQQNADLVVEGRNAAAVDIARVMGVPASLIDASSGDGASRTYENMSGRNAEFVDYGLAPFMSALVARLGMDDLCPRGQHVEINLDGFTSLRPANLATPDDGADPAPLPVENRKATA